MVIVLIDCLFSTSSITSLAAGNLGVSQTPQHLPVDLSAVLESATVAGDLKLRIIIAFNYCCFAPSVSPNPSHRFLSLNLSVATVLFSPNPVRILSSPGTAPVAIINDDFRPGETGVLGIGAKLN